MCTVAEFSKLCWEKYIFNTKNIYASSKRERERERERERGEMNDTFVHETFHPVAGQESRCLNLFLFSTPGHLSVIV